MSEKDSQKNNFYKRLKLELEKNTEWPIQYMYKFIIYNNYDDEIKILETFRNKKIEHKTNLSRTGKYKSITIITKEKNANDIIKHYRSVENIEGLVAL